MDIVITIIIIIIGLAILFVVSIYFRLDRTLDGKPMMILADSLKIQTIFSVKELNLAQIATITMRNSFYKGKDFVDIKIVMRNQKKYNYRWIDKFANYIETNILDVIKHQYPNITVYKVGEYDPTSPQYRRTQEKIKRNIQKQVIKNRDKNL